MRLTLFGLVLLAATLLAEPTQSDRYRYAPMVSAAKLWNMIRYLDPRVTGDSTAWDAALVAAIPKIETAHSDEELALALDDMLKNLQDPCTRIAGGLPGIGVSVQSLEAGTMVIHAGNGELSGSIGAGLMLKMGIPQTDNIVWDLRGARSPHLLVSRPDLRQLPINGIGYAFRQHSGYPPREGTGQRFFSSSIQVVLPQPDAARQATASRRQVYLIDKDSAVPIQAIMDQINGRTAIFSEDPPRDPQAGFTEMVTVLGKVVAEVRVAELYYADGTTGFAPSRVTLNRGQEAIKPAVEAIQTAAWGMPGERPDFALLPAAFRDMPYPDNPYPERPMRILGAFRAWGILHYFNPRVAALGNKWDDVLIELLPKVSEARNALEYHLAIAELVARSGDPTGVAKSTAMEGLLGGAVSDFEARFLDNQAVITHVFKGALAHPGDVIVKIAGEPVQERIDRIARYFAVPASSVLQTQLGSFALTVRGKDNTEHDIPATGDSSKRKVLPAHRTGDAVRMINADTGYVDLERLEASDLDAMFDKFQHTPAIIFDLRGYPRDNAMAIASRLGNRNQPLVAELQRPLVGIGLNDSHVSLLQSELRIPGSVKPRYKGKTVALIDDVSPGIAAETAMCLKAASNTVLVGSEVFPNFRIYSTGFDVPGGIKVFFTGQGVRWPDGTAMPSTGVHPDVEVLPSIAGLRADQDEVLDGALAYLSSASK